MSRGSEFLYHGLYINLERSVERRERMESELAAHGILNRYARFPAVDGTLVRLPPTALSPGEAGAFFSHARALESARRQGAPVHILEDDALLSRHTAPVIEEAIAAGLLERFDILFTDTLLPPHLGMLKALKSAFGEVEPKAHAPLRLADLTVIDLSRENFSCLTSYVVAPEAMDRLGALYRAELESGPAKPVDLFVRDAVLAGRLRAGLLFPFVTSFRLEEVARSTIAAGGPPARPSVMVLAVLRHLFFIERDLALAKACLDAATRALSRAEDPHRAMIVQALDFILSDAFQEF